VKNFDYKHRLREAPKRCTIVMFLRWNCHNKTKWNVVNGTRSWREGGKVDKS